MRRLSVILFLSGTFFLVLSGSARSTFADTAGGERGVELCANDIGDVNASGATDFTDAIAVLSHLFLGDPESLAENCAAGEISALEAQLAEQEAALAERDATIAERDAALAEQEETIAARDMALAEREADMTTLVAERDTLQESLSTAQTELTTANANLATANADLDTCNTNYSTCSNDLETANSQLATANSELATKTSQLATANAELATCSTNYSTCSSDLETTNAQLTTANAELATCSTNYSTCSSNLETANSQLTAAEGNLQSTQDGLNTCQDDLQTAQNDLASCLGVPLPLRGCTDPEASNYNADATQDDGSCEYAEPEIPDGFSFVAENAQGYAEYTHDASGIEFVLLPGGEFEMGSPDTEDGRFSNEAKHTVKLSPFLIAKYEVTQAEYAAVMTGNTAELSATPSHHEGDNRPVESVSWDDLKAADGFLGRTGLSLPSEAQWEYACRAGQSGPYSGTGDLDDMGWYSENSGGSHHPVGTKQANQFGLFDMHGNVFEWCEDVFNENFYDSEFSYGPDPVATSGSEGRVFRGGVYDTPAGFCRSATRDRDFPGPRSFHIGFRPARPLPAEALLGCTDPEASNYNADATQDDGSCETATCILLTAEHTGDILADMAASSPGLTAAALGFSLSGHEAVSFEPSALGFDEFPDTMSIAFWVKLSANESQSILEVRGGRVTSRFETAPERTDEIWYSMEAQLGDGADGQVFEEGAWSHVVLQFDRSRGIQTYTNGRPSLMYRIRQPEAPQPVERIEFIAQGTTATIYLSDIQVCDGPLTQQTVSAMIEQATEQNEDLSAGRLEAALGDIEGHLDGSLPIPANDQGALVDALSESMFHLSDPDLAQRAADLVHLFEMQEGAFFVSPKGDFTRDQSGEFDWALFRLQQGVADYGFRPSGGFPETNFLTAAYFPGPVGDDVPRLTNETVSIRATNQLPTAYHLHQDAKHIVRLTGLYVPPGEVVELVAPTSIVGQGIEIRVGIHDEQYDIWPIQQRFPRVLTRFNLDSETTQVANPFGGALLVLIPVGLDLGLVEISVSGAVEAPHFFATADQQTTVDAWLESRNTEVPWAQIVGDNFMFSIPTSMVQTLNDPTPVVTAWNLAMDGYMEMFSRPTERHRPEYFIADVRNPAGAFGPGYPTIMGGYKPGMEDAGWNPLKLVDPSQIGPAESSIFIVLHEYGHQHFFPTLPGETEVNVNLPATYVYHQKLGYTFEDEAPTPIDGAFMNSIHQQLTRDEAAVNWMITRNFADGAPMGIDEDHPNFYDQLSYQSRGFAKYVDFAALLGWDALAGAYEPYVDHDIATGQVTLHIEPEDFILNASHSAGVNTLPLFHFWGVLTPDEALRAANAAYPPSDEIRDRLLAYRALIPADKAAFGAHFESISDTVTDSWTEFYAIRQAAYDEGEAQKARDHLDGLILSYYPEANVTDGPTTGAVPLFVVAGQSNAEGNARLGGLEAFKSALPSHDSELSTEERASLREAYQVGIGDWCDPTADYSDASADGAIDAFRETQLDISSVSGSDTIDGAEMAAFRWRHENAALALGAPYQSDNPNAHPAHGIDIAPMSVGFGVWDDDDSDVLFYGPELGFALRMEQSSSLSEFYMVKVAMGGSSLEAHWAPDGSMREQLYEKTNWFLEQRDSYVAGLIWFQGFNDQFEDSARDNYEQNLGALITDFRTTYGEDTPVVIVQARKVGDLAVIADAQQSFVDSTSNTALVESDGMSDCFHYDSVSQLVIGDRCGTSMMELLEPDTDD